jgi:ATP phosphoribosyltransferase
VKLGLACDDGPPPATLFDLLGAAGLPVAAVAGADPPALIQAEGDAWALAPGADVLTACLRGVLDVAIVGKDLLLERQPDLAELLDLRLSTDELVYAGVPGSDRGEPPRPRVATPYPGCTWRYFAGAGRQVEPIAFRVAALAPALGLADGVMDLRSRIEAEAPGLVVREEIAACSLRLVAGRAARILYAGRLEDLVERLRSAVGGWS